MLFFRCGEFIPNGQLGDYGRLVAAACTEKIRVPAVAGGIVPSAMSGDLGSRIQPVAAASACSAGNCIYNTAGADCRRANQPHCR